MRIVPVLLASLVGLLVPGLAAAHDAEPSDRIVPRYPSYPYAQRTEGYVRRVPYSDPEGEQAKLWSVRVGGEGGYLGRQGRRAGGRLLLRYWRVGLSADGHYYSGWGERSPFYLGGAHGTLDLIMRPHFGLRVGPGLLARVDAEIPAGQRPSVEVGSNVMTEVDIMPMHPIIASGRFDVGRIGDETAVSGRVSVGVMIRRVEVALAYEAKLIGETPLRGPQLSLRAWF